MVSVVKIMFRISMVLNSKFSCCCQCISLVVVSRQKVDKVIVFYVRLKGMDLIRVVCSVVVVMGVLNISELLMQCWIMYLCCKVYRSEMLMYMRKNSIRKVLVLVKCFGVQVVVFQIELIMKVKENFSRLSVCQVLNQVMVKMLVLSKV